MGFSQQTQSDQWSSVQKFNSYHILVRVQDWLKGKSLKKGKFVASKFGYSAREFDTLTSNSYYNSYSPENMCTNVH